MSDQVLDAMDDIETAYCYMDDFYSGSLEPLYEAALKLEINDFLSNKTTIQLHKLFASAAKSARIDISDKELEVYQSILNEMLIIFIWQYKNALSESPT